MIREIHAKTLLSTVSGDDVFGDKYNMNLYRGCEHRCIYCDSRSECYGIENFHDVLVKVNAIELLERELSRKRIKGRIGTGSMSDPYTYAERQYQLMRQTLSLIARYGFPVQIRTKSDLVLRDLELLVEINRVQALVTFTLTTVDDELARKVEPGAPLPSARLHAMEILAQAGICVGVNLMPVLPFLEDSLENITAIVKESANHGARFILPWFGVTLRDRQRDYYYSQLDKLFPDLRRRYEITYGNSYFCAAQKADQLGKHFRALCQTHGLEKIVPPYLPAEKNRQLSLW
jgi:DNA repair photolyase